LWYAHTTHFTPRAAGDLNVKALSVDKIISRIDELNKKAIEMVNDQDQPENGIKCLK
jgi:hypothetical protein